jgi:hypothetical protein
MLYNRRVPRAALLFLLYLTISLVTRAPFIPIEILDMDEAAHAVGSWVWMEGGHLYRDFINNKPPLLYVYYAFAQIVFGKGLVAVHLMTAVVVLPLTALAVSRFFDHDRTGLYAGAMYLTLSAAFLAHDMHSTNAEILMVLPGAWAVTVVRNVKMARSGIRLFLCGVLFGTGFLFKYQIALGTIAVAVACWRVGSHKWIYAFGGLAVPPGIALLLFHLSGGVNDLLYWLLWNNLQYSANPISFQEGLGRFASYLLPFLIVTAPLSWLAVRAVFQSPADGVTNDKYRRTLAIVLLFVSIPPVFVGFRFYPHYFIQLYFPLILLAGPLIVDSKYKRAFVRYAIVLLCITTAVNVYLYYGTETYREQDPVYRKIAERLKQDECYSGSALFVWGYAPAFYYYAEVKPASRFVVMGQARLTGYVSGNLGSLDRIASAGVPRHWDWLFADLEKNNVTYILDTAPAAIYRWNHFPMDNFPRLKTFVLNEFERMDTVDDVVIYRRRQCSSE